GEAGCAHTGVEFFKGDDPSDSWTESGLGALVNLETKPGVVSTSYDPRGYTSEAAVAQQNNIYNENGVINLAKDDGNNIGNYAVFDSGNQGPTSNPESATHPEAWWAKTNGLGDLEALCDAAPLEIGNRVWLDENGNG